MSAQTPLQLRAEIEGCKSGIALSQEGMRNSRQQIAHAEAALAQQTAQYTEECARLAQLNAMPWDTAPGILPSLKSAPTLEQRQRFGELLRHKRDAAGLTRQRLGEMAGLSDATIKFIETARFAPSRTSLTRLVGVPALDLSMAEVVAYLLPAAGANGGGQ